MSQKRRKAPAGYIEPVGELMRAWLDAAEKWRRLRSDPAAAACRAARAAYYQSVYGCVPQLRADA